MYERGQRQCRKKVNIMGSFRLSKGQLHDSQTLKSTRATAKRRVSVSREYL